MSTTTGDLVAAFLNNERVRHAFFTELHFTTGIARLWQGYREITINGLLWQPVGQIGTITSMEDPIADSQATFTMALNGVDAELLAVALSSADEVRGQLAFIYDQFFDDNWQPIGDFESYAVVRMDTVKVTRKAGRDDSWERVIEVPCENFLTNGVNPTNGRYSQADQGTRFPDVTDNYFQYMMVNQNKRVRWPP